MLDLSLRELTLLVSCSATQALSNPYALFAGCLDPPQRSAVADAVAYLARIDALEAPHAHPALSPAAFKAAARGGGGGGADKPSPPTFLGRLLASLPLALPAARLAVAGARGGHGACVNSHLFFALLIYLSHLTANARSPHPQSATQPCSPL